VSRRSALFLAISLCTSALFTGCGIGTVDHSSGGTFNIQGVVFGGQQPVTDAKIQLYTVGSSGNASAATAMLVPTITSGYGGNFSITGDYICGKSSAGGTIPAGSNQVYIVATDGNPGLTANNPKMVLMAALGPCSSLSTTQFIEINEVTTAAAAWALAPFMTSYTHVGASSSNATGITNAFLDAALLVDTSTGLAAKLPPGTNLTVETNKLYALANSIASCVNSDGGSACTPLLLAATPTFGTEPSDTLTAALNIVKNPGENVAAVYNAAGGFAPFPSGYKKAPNDWTMSLTVTGGGLDFPIALAIDAVGNVWVAGHDGPLSAFNPQGTPLTATGYGVGKLEDSNGIAIDIHGDIWVTQYNDTFGSHSGAVTKFLGINAPSGTQGSIVLYNGYPGFFIDIYFPYAVAADTNGDMYVANNGNGSATVLASDGSVLGPYYGGGVTSGSFPETIAIDSTHGFWLPTSGIHVDHISADGNTLLSSTACCSTAWGVATDSYGDVWVADYEGASFSEVGPDGTLLIGKSEVGGIFYPQHVSVDAAQNVWFGNVLGHSITEIAANHGSDSPGVAISPTGVDGSGGYGHDASLSYTSFIAPDASGNIWVTNANINTVTMFFGLATPTVTPIQPIPTAP
jgi:hypothetical protein